MTEENKNKKTEEKKSHPEKNKPEVEEKTETQVQTEKPAEASQETKSEKKEESKDSKKKKETPKVKKYEAVAHGVSLPISKKHSMYISNAIKGKKIDDAIEYLQGVRKFKHAVPFKGEIPHRKGNMMSGRYPISASKHFINMLKALKGNAIVNGLELERTIIVESSPSWASRPPRSGGRRAKRVNLNMKVKEITLKEKKK